ncbi:hypothetical protein [Listeria booriae]|uniref:hypothetical protein n=1 Tax=Listeria booriae TaxID=1552123 RepID=UPI0016281AEE|nr:hypothetical protein [Listeria booriae]MBC1284389.1 hypothetical protein [Listeria booriae]MBC1811428.1 hypothetical protein [Listeria booriae]MBC1982658.1 hypothetical protein [Listeria booriae]
MSIKVVKIIDDERIVINAGTENGIKIHQQLSIIDKEGDEVIDPDTGASLGSLDIVKAIVEVEATYPKMSVCVNPEMAKSTAEILDSLTKAQSSAFRSAFLAGTKRKNLNVNLEQVTGGYNNEKGESTINIGDKAKLIN